MSNSSDNTEREIVMRTGRRGFRQFSDALGETIPNETPGTIVGEGLRSQVERSNTNSYAGFTMEQLESYLLEITANRVNYSNYNYSRRKRSGFKFERVELYNSDDLDSSYKYPDIEYEPWSLSSYKNEVNFSLQLFGNSGKNFPSILATHEKLGDENMYTLLEESGEILVCKKGAVYLTLFSSRMEEEMKAPVTNDLGKKICKHRGTYKPIKNRKGDLICPKCKLSVEKDTFKAKSDKVKESKSYKNKRPF